MLRKLSPVGLGNATVEYSKPMDAHAWLLRIFLHLESRGRYGIVGRKGDESRDGGIFQAQWHSHRRKSFATCIRRLLRTRYPALQSSRFAPEHVFEMYDQAERLCYMQRVLVQSCDSG